MLINLLKCSVYKILELSKHLLPKTHIYSTKKIQITNVHSVLGENYIFSKAASLIFLHILHTLSRAPYCFCFVLLFIWVAFISFYFLSPNFFLGCQSQTQSPETQVKICSKRHLLLPFQATPYSFPTGLPCLAL